LVEDEKQISLNIKNNLEDQIKVIESEKSKNNEFNTSEINRLEESIKTLRNELEIEKNLVEEWKSNSSNIKNNLEEQIKTLETENKNIRDKSNLSELSNMESKRLEESIKGLNIEIGIKEKLIEEEKLMALNVKNNFEDQITKLEQEKSKNHELTILEANRLDSIIKNLKHELEIEKNSKSEEIQNSLIMKNNLEDQIKSIEKEKSKNINVKDLEINRLEENMKKLQHDFELQNKIIEEEKNTLDKMKNFFEEKN